MEEFKATPNAWAAIVELLQKRDADALAWLTGIAKVQKSGTKFTLESDHGVRLTQLATALKDHGIPKRTGGYINKMIETCETLAGSGVQKPKPKPEPKPEPAKPEPTSAPAPEPALANKMDGDFVGGEPSPPPPQLAPQPQAQPQPEEPRFNTWREAFAELADDLRKAAKKADDYAKGLG